MDGLEEKLGSLLSDPTAMEKLRQLAGALSGSMPDLGPGFGSGPEPEGPGGLFGGGEGKLAELLGKVMGAYGAPSEAAKLVAALGPWLQPERRERLEKALRVARFASAASPAEARRAEPAGEAGNGGSDPDPHSVPDLAGKRGRRDLDPSLRPCGYEFVSSSPGSRNISSPGAARSACSEVRR